jgi:hypothetical protein
MSKNMPMSPCRKRDLITTPFFSNLYTSFGPRVAWVMEVLLLSFTIALWLIFYNRMVPLIPPEPTKERISSESNEKT